MHTLLIVIDVTLLLIGLHEVFHFGRISHRDVHLSFAVLPFQKGMGTVQAGMGSRPTLFVGRGCNRLRKRDERRCLKGIATRQVEKIKELGANYWVESQVYGTHYWNIHSGRVVGMAMRETCSCREEAYFSRVAGSCDAGAARASSFMACCIKWKERALFLHVS